MVKRATYFIIAILFFVGLFWILSQPPKTTNNNSTSNQNNEATPSAINIYKDFPVYENPDLVFYLGDTCPHCKNVEDWLDKNNTDKKLKINYKEVYYNQENQKTLSDTVKQYCPELMQNGGIGVPVGFDPVNKKCIQGDNPIIEFLSAKLK